MSTPHKKDDDVLGATEGSLRVKWADGAERRAASRAKAERELKRVRNAVLRRAAIASKADARARGATQYEGKECCHHKGWTTRMVSTGHCTICNRERDDKRRMARGVYGLRGRRKPRPARTGQHH
jgi:hypothetical protein